MLTYLLDAAQFSATFAAPMREPEESELFPLDLAPYVTECLREQKVSVSLANLEIERCYISGDGKYTHIMLLYGKANEYLVVVADNRAENILGHHWLDLNAKYAQSQALASDYREMAADKEREAEALDWSEGLIGDAIDEHDDLRRITL